MLAIGLALDGRLDVLCCLLDESPLTAVQLSARTGATPKAVTYFLQTLEMVELVEKVAGANDEPQYIARLKDQPEWVRARVDDHRRG